jgi:alpha,alpha-trehalose phosphorylase
MSEEQEHGIVDPERFDAVLFDMDGVLTTTRRMHALAWKRTFDEFLDAWDAKRGSHTPRFSVSEDYPAFVDGKPREEGVRDFLASRGIDLPEGTLTSPPTEWSVYGVGNHKQEFVEEALREQGVEVFPGSVAWLRELRELGLKTAVVTSSTNCEAVLDAAGIRNLLDAQVDGRTAIALDLAGKPAPDTYLEAARQLEIEPARAAVVEDSRAGVEAAHSGGFSLVIGVNRDGQADELRAAGADVIVSDLAELVARKSDMPHQAGPRSHRLRASAARLLAADAEFPVDQQRLIERRFEPSHVPQFESIFALSNGYLGLRGMQDEGRPVYDPAPILNGFYETWPLEYPERAYGFAETGQSVVGVPDGTIVRLYLDDEPFSLEEAEILDYERVLDMSRGTLERSVVWRATDGSRIAIRSRRLVSFAHRHLATVEYEVTSLDRAGHLTISSELKIHPEDNDLHADDPRRSRALGEGVLTKVDERVRDQRVILAYQTQASGLRMACGMDHRLRGGKQVGSPEVLVDEDWSRVVYRIRAEQGEPVRMVKFLAYHNDDAEPSPELTFRADETLNRGTAQGIRRILKGQRTYLDDFWARSDVITEGAPLVQQAVRFNLFQLLQASARVEGYGIPAKGLTGRGYGGNYFWDAEIYVLPFLTYTSPLIGKNLLRHRYGMLGKARERAIQVSQRGALFPWRTINGEEASAYYAAGTAQYHIDADVAYAVVQYVSATGDTDFLAHQGTEILVETARLWASLGFFSEQKEGRFVINGVTGPDEYSALVDNNAFTNLMAQENMRQAVKAVRWLRETDPEAHSRMVERTSLENWELEVWQQAADRMYVPYDQQRRLYLQDDSFLDLELWDFENTPAEHYPLLLHYHPLVLYRHQVVKQADVVLATFLLGDLFTEEDKRNILDYYDPLTTSDSSLSECIQCIMAAEVAENLRAAEEYFVDAVGIDLADAAGNVRDGIHVASAGGTWMALVYGFGGMRHRGEQISFRPRMPERLNRLAFKIQVKGSTLSVSITGQEAAYTLESGDELTFLHHGETLHLGVGKSVSRPLASS